MNKNLESLRNKMNNINKITDDLQKLNEARKLFVDILKNEDIYIVASKETTKEELEDGRVKAYIVTEQAGSQKNYLRIFTDNEVANDFARKNGAVLEDGREIVIKEKVEEIAVQITDAFMMIGLDGILLEDGVNWITISTEEFLRIAYVDVLDIPNRYDKDFVNTVRAVHDINRRKYRLVAPIKHYEGIKKDDFLNGQSKLFKLNNELLILEYYDKYKVENIFKDKVYWLDMDIEMFYSVVERAKEESVEKINIVYNGIQAQALPKDILNLLKALKVQGK